MPDPEVGGAPIASPTLRSPDPGVLSTRHGKLLLALLCSVAFLDFADTSIVNVALPSIQSALHFSVQGLQWVPSGYLVTYGGFMLLGGRAADLFGRRRILLAGIVVIAIACTVGGSATSAGVFIVARLVQGLGAAMSLPAALSILTTTFPEGRDRNTAVGIWAAVGGLASAVGVIASGFLTEGPGWRWVMFVNPIACLLLLGPIFRLIRPELPNSEGRRLDALGALLVTGGTTLLMYALVRAPSVGWGSVRTVGELAAAAVVLGLFVLNELRHPDPLAPLSIFRINGLGFADVTQLAAFAGFLGLFFFLTLYMQDVLGYSPIRTGVAYLPLCGVIAVSAGVSSQLMARVGTRPLVVIGAVIAAVGLFWLSHLSEHASYSSGILPGLVVISVGVGPVFVGTTAAANAGVPPDKAGLAAALLNASQQVGGALGLAIFTAVATSRLGNLLAGHTPAAAAMTDAFRLPLLIGSGFMLAAAVVALRATNTTGEIPASE